MEKLDNSQKVVILNKSGNILDYKIGIVVDSCQEGMTTEYKVIDVDGKVYYGYYVENFVSLEYYKYLLKKTIKEVLSTIQNFDDIASDKNFSNEARCRILEETKIK